MELKSLLEGVRVGEQTVLDITGGEKERKLSVELRKLHPEKPRPPERAESPARGHEFLSAKSLADYLARYGQETTVVFADPSSELVSAVINEETSQGFEVVSMKPAVHPLWAPWAALSGRKIALREFASFVAQNRRAVVEPDGRELALTLSQIRASLSVEIMSGRGNRAVNGLVVRSRVTGGAEQSDMIDLPDTIKLRVPLYVDTQPKDVELDLCIEASADGDVTVLVSSGTVAEARVAAFSEMVETIRSGIAELGAVLTFGRPKHAPWSYLKELEAKA